MSRGRCFNISNKSLKTPSSIIIYEKRREEYQQFFLTITFAQSAKGGILNPKNGEGFQEKLQNNKNDPHKKTGDARLQVICTKNRTSF